MASSSEQAEQPSQAASCPATENAASREPLIVTAVKFLQNPRVRQSPVATRRAFLKKKGPRCCERVGKVQLVLFNKINTNHINILCDDIDGCCLNGCRGTNQIVKGLTDEEIDLAFQQSGTGTDEPQSPGPSSQLVPAQPAHPVLHSPPSSRWRDYGALAIIMTGIAFGFHQLYKKYLLPLIMGVKEDRKQLQRIESNLSEMSGSVTQTVTQLQTTLAAVQELLIQQQQKIQELTQELAASKATTSTNWILESQNINELKSEIYSLKGLLLNRRQFPPSPSAPKIPSWQIPVKPSSPSNPVVANHNSSSDISPVSNESTTSSPVKENHSPEGSKVSCHLLSTEEGNPAVIDVKSQVRMEVQGEEEKRETKRSEEEEEDDEDDDVSHVDEEECLGVQTEDRRGGDGQINEQVEKLRRPEGASNENEID